MLYIIVKNNIIDNIIDANQDFVESLGEEYKPYYNGASVGDIYDPTSGMYCDIAFAIRRGVNEV